MIRQTLLLSSLILFAAHSLPALEKHSQPPFRGHETFEVRKPERFTQFPEKNSEVKDGVLSTRGESGGKYPPMVGIPIAEKDCTISFRYRHLGDGNMIWLFINGEDGFGGFDHILRVKLTRNAISLQVDAHTKDPNHPDVQKDRKPDATSGAYRAGEKLPPQQVKGLDDDAWHELELVFEGDTVEIKLDGRHWKTKLSRLGFAFEKQEIAMFLAGGEKGIEIDDLKVTSD
jgi:hypothetical protein